jgi:hypothetical protein
MIESFVAGLSNDVYCFTCPSAFRMGSKEDTNQDSNATAQLQIHSVMEEGWNKTSRKRTVEELVPVT